MAPFDECCVLIPSATLEDFPSGSSDFDARSMLAAWTVLWHPRLLAQSEQLPTWYRADSPPDADGPKIVVVPTISTDQLPRGYEAKCRKNADCRWVTGESREQMLEQLDLAATPSLTWESRTIGPADFFAAGYVSLQVQVMTRRLRYTSNLDEIHLQGRAVAAAKALVEGNAAAAVEALHDVFDCLAEERDHYFSSDPHLIDLTLLSRSTLSSFIDQQLDDLLARNPAGDPSAGDPSDQWDDEGPVRRTAGNVLIDHDVAGALSSQPGDQRHQRLTDALSSQRIGWAGGDPDPKICLDAMSFHQADTAMREGWQLATSAIGTPPTVYARLAGATPADLTPTAVGLGYQGMIPIDFTRGSGFGDEAKVIRQGGGAEIQALTAKPIDAASDASFLDLGARLGEAIDSGEIATALLVHWPAAECDSFADLKCAASWSLALGRFWKLDDYFTRGEHPYHHGTAASVSPEASGTLTQQVQQQSENPLSAPASAFRQCITQETAEVLAGMIALVDGDASGEEDQLTELNSLAARFGEVSGAQGADGKVTSMLCVNPNGSGVRDLVSLDGHAPAAGEHIYGASMHRGQASVSVDVPAYGFATIGTADKPQKQGNLWERLLSRVKTIAEGTTLTNKFMEVVIHPKTGGIQGVYSGAVRGNRFSMRLVSVSPDDDEPAGDEAGGMVAEKIRVVASGEERGAIEAIGRIVDSDAKTIASFSLMYQLQRGSRLLQVTGRIKPENEIKGDPWRRYLGARVAVSSEAAIVRPLLRDKVHRSRSRRLVAPLGVVVDEAERQTLISAAGLPYHRRFKDRFVDTLLAVEGEREESFELNYGFDVSNPVPTAKSMLTGQLCLPIQPSSKLPPRGWILHLSPAEMLINRVEVRTRQDGRLAATVRLIQSRSRAAKVTLRLCRDVGFAAILESDPNKDGAPSPWDVPIPNADDQEADDQGADDQNSSQPYGLRWESDMIRFSAESHQITDLVIVFATTEKVAT